MVPGGFEEGELVVSPMLMVGADPTVRYSPALRVTSVGLVALASLQPFRFTEISISRRMRFR